VKIQHHHEQREVRRMKPHPHFLGPAPLDGQAIFGGKAPLGPPKYPLRTRKPK